MKLEKREVTLNEKDSLKDVLYLETLLSTAYANQKGAYRQETKNRFADLEKEILKEKELIEKLYKKA